MASVAVTNITNISRTISNRKGTALNIGGLPVEVFRIASGQAQGDTATLTPATFSNIQAVAGPVHHALPATGASSITVTLPAVSPGSTVATATIGQVDVWLIGPLPTS
jgi:hypothetical protein